MNPYDIPKTTADESDLSTDTRRPPPLVMISIAGVTLSLLLGLIKIMYFQYQRGIFHMDKIGAMFAFFIVFSLFTGLIYILLRGLYRGSRVAFWITIGYAAMGVISFKYSLHQVARFPTQWEKGLYVFQGFTQFSSVVALLFPRSWRWFHRKKSMAVSTADSNRS